ncbi:MULTISPECIES: hypothetical protein [unclassified Streptomyces]|uniref:hypothetical protein n=1 Tax=unclassified Streptomyces TaxID=2593676 RepID=UPI0036E7BD29
MFKERRRRRALRRVQPGDGRPLQPFRWWQLPGRALLYMQPAQAGDRPPTYAVDVRHWQNQSSGNVKAHLYLDGRLHAESKIPAVFPVPGGSIEVAMSGFGLKRCHYVTPDGAERQLTPDPASAEGRRARLVRNHPALSRAIGSCSLLALLVGAALLILQIAEPVSEIPPVAARIGSFDSPLHLPLWLNITLGAAAALGSMERALRLRYSRLLDSVAN